LAPCPLAITSLDGTLLSNYTSPVAAALLALSIVSIFWFLSQREIDEAETRTLGGPDGETLD